MDVYGCKGPPTKLEISMAYVAVAILLFSLLAMLVLLVVVLVML